MEEIIVEADDIAQTPGRVIQKLGAEILELKAQIEEYRKQLCLVPYNYDDLDEVDAGSHMIAPVSNTREVLRTSSEVRARLETKSARLKQEINSNA